METLFLNKWKIFTNRNFAMKTVYFAFKFVLNKNQSDWSMTSHSAQLHF